MPLRGKQRIWIPDVTLCELRKGVCDERPASVVSVHNENVAYLGWGARKADGVGPTPGKEVGEDKAAGIPIAICVMGLENLICGLNLRKRPEAE